MQSIINISNVKQKKTLFQNNYFNVFQKLFFQSKLMTFAKESILDIKIQSHLLELVD